MASAVLTWRADPAAGEERFEQARVETDPGGLRARGTVLVGSGELVGPDGPYRVDYELDTVEDFATHRLVVRVEGAGWRRELWLRRSAGGDWSCRRLSEPDDHRPGIDDPATLAGALDCDLLSSALFNMMPVARTGLHRQPGRQRVPDGLGVDPGADRHRLPPDVRARPARGGLVRLRGRLHRRDRDGRRGVRDALPAGGAAGAEAGRARQRCGVRASRSAAAPPAQSRTPTRRGSGRRVTAKRSRTPSRSSRASATSSAVLPPPRWVSARVCLPDTRTAPPP